MVQAVAQRLPQKISVQPSDIAAKDQHISRKALAISAGSDQNFDAEHNNLRQLLARARNRNADKDDVSARTRPAASQPQPPSSSAAQPHDSTTAQLHRLVDADCAIVARKSVKPFAELMAQTTVLDEQAERCLRQASVELALALARLAHAVHRCYPTCTCVVWTTECCSCCRTALIRSFVFR